ncbi:MAG: TrmH family RNA methyltransferase [Chitinivorax sp.]
MFDNIRIVLCHTSHPGNIGSTARAMKVMGLKRLYLVNPQSFPDPHATALASSADDVLEQCQCAIRYARRWKVCTLRLR